MLIALDIGGTKFDAASADGDGAIIRRVTAPTPVDLNQGLALLEAMARDVAGGQRPDAIGATCGGPLDADRGVVSPLHQPAWRAIPLRDFFQAAFGCPFRVEVDTDAAALAEVTFGRASPARMLYITLSTGMGGGLIVDGRIYRGANGAHPEIGHQAIPYRLARGGPVVCECGAKDCAEALVSGNAIRRLYGKPAEALDEAEWAEVTHNLGQALRNAAALYAPQDIVLGGGVAVGRGKRLAEEAGAVMRAGLRIVPAPRVRLSALGYDTALMGAIALAQRAATTA